MSQLVELLGISQATGSPPSTEEVVIITVRSQPDSFHPHNIALKKTQAVRLLKDLESLLRPTVVVLVACVALVAAGCSARVEVERTTDATATEITPTEFQRTTVELDFQPRSPQPVIQREPPPVTVPPEPQPVIVTNNTVVLNYRGGDVTYHSDTHIHVHDAAKRQVEERVVIRPEVQAEYRPVDPRCEQLRREHEERVRTWRAFPLGE